ncbi:MFS transporter [Streptomyces sp. NPDC014685]|uniref:MFS transporter n=1 Tax=Streptomyces sp. NPDC014685 TaxID=3364881 RepID=UPI0036F7BCE9
MKPATDTTTGPAPGPGPGQDHRPTTQPQPQPAPDGNGTGGEAVNGTGGGAVNGGGAGAGSGGGAGKAAAPPPAPLRRNRDYRLLWGGAGLSLLAGRATAVAYPLAVLWATASPADAGLVGTALLLPQLVVQLPAGALVDRWDRRRILLAAGLGQAVVTGAVAALLLSGHIWLWALLAAAFAEGTLGVLFQLAERAAVPAVVPPGQIGAAMTGNEARTRAAAITGQPLGSALVTLGTALPFAAAALGQLASTACLFKVRGKLQQERRGTRETALAAEVRAGLAWMWRQHFLRAVMAAIAVSNLLFQGLNLAVMSGIQSAGGTEFQAGVVLSLSGAGGLAGALSGGKWTERLSMRALVIGGLAAWALLMVPVAVLRDPYALGAIFALSGYVGGVFNVAGGVYLVRIAPDRMRGRANSLAMLVGGGAMAAGPVAAGFALEGMGPTRTILALSLAMAATALAALLSPALRRGPFAPAR